RHTRSKRDWSSDVCSSDLCCACVPGGHAQQLPIILRNDEHGKTIPTGDGFYDDLFAIFWARVISGCASLVATRRIYRGTTPTGIFHGRCRRIAFWPSSCSIAYFSAPTDRPYQAARRGTGCLII